MLDVSGIRANPLAAINTLAEERGREREGERARERVAGEREGDVSVDKTK